MAATGVLFAATEEDVFVQADVATVFGEDAAIDEGGAGFGERAFAVIGKFIVEDAGEDELQDGVAEEFEALIGLDV